MTHSAGQYADEVERIRVVYAGRTRAAGCPGRSLLAPYNLCAVQEREQVLIELLRRRGVESLAGMNILDVGCGEGMLLRHLLDHGAEPRRSTGIDLLEERVQKGARLSPGLGFLSANGAELPFGDSRFDLVFQFCVFTSVLDARIRQALAAELLRVLRPQGVLVWYDFFYDNPRNANVRGIGRAEIAGLFPGCRLTLRRVTLAPPLGRVVAPLSPALYHILSRLRIFCTHYLCLVEKR